MALRRFIQIGDLHLGPHARNTDRKAALTFAVEDAMRGGPLAAWLWPGDLDHGRQTIDDKNFLIGQVQRMAEVAPVVICYGNHDLPGDLDFLAKLKAEWPIIVISRPKVIPLALASGGAAAIFVFPYPTRVGLVAAGTAPGAVVEAAKEALQAIFHDAAAQLQDYARNGFVPLVIGHVNVAGSVMSAGQPSIGKEIELDEALLQTFPHMFIGLNHIHRAQEISGAVYAGSLCRLDWSEIDPKSYLEITYGPPNWGGYSGDGPWDGTDHYTFDWCRKPVDVPPMYLVEGELTREGFSWWFKADEVRQTVPSSIVFTDADVRVRFTFNAAEKSLLNFELVKAPFAGARRIETDPVAVRDRAIRAPEVLTAKTLDAKVQAYIENMGQPWTPALEEKLAAIQQVFQ